MGVSCDEELCVHVTNVKFCKYQKSFKRHNGFVQYMVTMTQAQVLSTSRLVHILLRGIRCRFAVVSTKMFKVSLFMEHSVFRAKF